MNVPRHVSYDETLLKVLNDPAEAAAFIEAVIEMEIQLHWSWQSEK